ncbi:MAG: UPF0182 family protein [bacterium]|nr:UPF0182 family protein [bacterium]
MGELTYPPVFTNTLTEEFDYPKGDKNVYCTYEGDGGIPLLNFLRKFAFALRFDGIKLLLAKYLTPKSRIMFRRQITHRVLRIAPFLRYDADPYIVISKEGKLFWLWDAYTISSRFPYSERFAFQGDTINYIRNSVKVLIDAYNGGVKFFVFDTKDPIIRTWSNIFPSLFFPKAEFPTDLLQHLRYPEDLLSLQARVYATYHMTDPNVFYNKEDLWSIAQEVYIERTQPMLPYYVIVKLDKEIEFIQMIPFNPVGKNNLIAWLAGRCDGEFYGTLLAYKFPYVEPLYLQATESRMPELKKVIVASGDRLVWADNFSGAIHNLITEYRAPVTKREEVGIEEVGIHDLIGAALMHFNRYKELVGEGKFKEAGDELYKLEATLKRAAKQRK